VKKLLAAAFTLLALIPAAAAADGLAPPPVVPCPRVDSAVVIDGRLDEPAWREAFAAGEFRDIVNGRPARLGTRALVMHDDYALYVGFQLEEPDLRARLTGRDSRIYTENDVEIFIDGGDAYYELELNALGTVYEVYWIWKDALNKKRFRRPEFDPDGRPVMRLSGIKDHVHPRGERLGFLDWDLPGLKTAVAVNGTLNDPSDEDRGWSVEIVLPWRGLAHVLGRGGLPPAPGGELGMNLFRFQWRGPDGKKLKEPVGWGLSVHGVYDCHMPERFFRLELVGY
jgi:hypothetical protein